MRELYLLRVHSLYCLDILKCNVWGHHDLFSKVKCAVPQWKLCASCNHGSCKASAWLCQKAPKSEAGVSLQDVGSQWLGICFICVLQQPCYQGSPFSQRWEGPASLISQKGPSLLIFAFLILQPGNLITILALQVLFGYLIVLLCGTQWVRHFSTCLLRLIIGCIVLVCNLFSQSWHFLGMKALVIRYPWSSRQEATSE